VIHVVRTDEVEALAAAYALGALAADEAHAFERHLEDDGCAVCRREVEAMRAVCGDLGVAPDPVAPSAAVRARVLAEAAGRGAAVAAFAFLDAADGVWEPRAPGIERKTLAPLGPGADSWSYLVRMAPGAVLKPHAHDRTEHCFVVEGDVYVGDRHLHAGDFHLAPRGTRHDLVRSDGGCVFLVVEAL
jgi:anti-sigma factor ChrR (cupin superfamily)